jgi:16S rRNA (guanine527-N7)-methyltransferase
MSGRAAGPLVDEAQDRRRALALVPVSRETEERLALYVDLLRRWQAVKNLVGPSTLPVIWTRHVADSAQLPALAPDALRWVDLGSGAGFPGLVVAIMLRDRPGAQVDLIESNGRKGAFLREAIRATGAAARVHVGRIEHVVPTLQKPVDVVTSRALAPLQDLLAMSDMLLTYGARGLFLTGDDSPQVTESVGQALGPARYAFDVVASLTNPASRIIVARRSAPEAAPQA